MLFQSILEAFHLERRRSFLVKSSPGGSCSSRRLNIREKKVRRTKFSRSPPFFFKPYTSFTWRLTAELGSDFDWQWLQPMKQRRARPYQLSPNGCVGWEGLPCHEKLGEVVGGIPGGSRKSNLTWRRAHLKTHKHLEAAKQPGSSCNNPPWPVRHWL